MSKLQDTILGIGAGLGIGIASAHEDRPSFQLNSNRLIAEFLKQDRIIAVDVDGVPYVFIHGTRKGFRVMGRDMSIAETEAYLATQYRFRPGKGVLISCFNHYHPSIKVGDTVFETPEWAMTKGQGQASNLDYIPLPISVYQRVKANAWKSMKDQSGQSLI